MAKGKTTATLNSLLKLAALPIKFSEVNKAVNADQLSFLVFEINAENFAISIEQIEGVVDAPRITPLPNAPTGVMGVASVRGRMTLAMSLGSTDMPNKNKQRLILLKGDSQLGLLADRIDDVITLPEKDVQKAAKQKKALAERDQTISASNFYFRYKERLIPVLDVEQIGES